MTPKTEMLAFIAEDAGPVLLLSSPVYGMPSVGVVEPASGCPVLSPLVAAQVVLPKETPVVGAQMLA